MLYSTWPQTAHAADLIAQVKKIERNLYGLDEDEHLVWSWEEFCEAVKAGHMPAFRELEETEDSEWEPMPAFSLAQALARELRKVGTLR